MRVMGVLDATEQSSRPRNWSWTPGTFTVGVQLAILVASSLTLLLCVEQVMAKYIARLYSTFFNFESGINNFFVQKGCHSRKFGGAGYRGGKQWIDDKSSESLRPSFNSDLSKIKPEVEDEDSCKKCHGKVFELVRNFNLIFFLFK